MDQKRLWRVYLVELAGTFALVYFAAGAVCVNLATTPPNQAPTSAALPEHPGVLGVALAQGVVLAVMLVLTVPVTGGYLNPAITIMLWVFNRLETMRAVWLIGAQFLGAALAGWCIYSTFREDVLRSALMGTPHLNQLLFPSIYRGALLAGTGVELALTFFMVLAIFCVGRDGAHTSWSGVAAGAFLAGGAVLAYPLTGAAANPARWFGTVLFEFALSDQRPGSPILGDVFVYIAGPILGALAAGLFYFKVYAVAAVGVDSATVPPPHLDAARSTAIKVKK